MTDDERLLIVASLLRIYGEFAVKTTTDLKTMKELQEILDKMTKLAGVE